MDQEGQINHWLLDDADEDLNISLYEDDSENSDVEQPANSEHDNNVLEDIVCYTNDHLRKVRTNYTRESDVVDSNIDEIKALMGMLYLAGKMKSSHRIGVHRLTVSTVLTLDQRRYETRLDQRRQQSDSDETITETDDVEEAATSTQDVSSDGSSSNDEKMMITIQTEADQSDLTIIDGLDSSSN
uniref:Uncharacterized protein n=1 Tax=Timema genevievae TaxID=629358 RepID=A0A7R9K1W3_TIMGE|nr:unnamed protein product [Timema genevievae]